MPPHGTSPLRGKRASRFVQSALPRRKRRALNGAVGGFGVNGRGWYANRPRIRPAATRRDSVCASAEGDTPQVSTWGSISLKWYKRGVQGNIPAPGMRFFNGRWETHGSEPSVLGLVLNSKTHVL